jgi:hypothetical protein
MRTMKMLSIFDLVFTIINLQCKVSKSDQA